MTIAAFIERALPTAAAVHFHDAFGSLDDTPIATLTVTRPLDPDTLDRLAQSAQSLQNEAAAIRAGLAGTPRDEGSTLPAPDKARTALADAGAVLSLQPGMGETGTFLCNGIYRAEMRGPVLHVLVDADS